MHFLCLIFFLEPAVFALPYTLRDVPNYSTKGASTLRRVGSQAKADQQNEVFLDGEFSRIPIEEFVPDDVNNDFKTVKPVIRHISPSSNAVNLLSINEEKNAKLNDTAQKKYNIVVDPTKKSRRLHTNEKHLVQFCDKYLQGLGQISESNEKITSICEIYLELHNDEKHKAGSLVNDTDTDDESGSTESRVNYVVVNEKPSKHLFNTKKTILPNKNIHIVIDDLHTLPKNILARVPKRTQVTSKDLFFDERWKKLKNSAHDKKHSNISIKNLDFVKKDNGDEEELKNFTPHQRKTNLDSFIKELVRREKDLHLAYKPWATEDFFGDRGRTADILNNQDLKDINGINDKLSRDLCSPFSCRHRFRRQDEESQNVSYQKLKANRPNILDGRREWFSLGKTYQKR
ncbi:hypothetical protein ACJJTC_002065 [Scirpophaga incertulas]